MVENKNNQTERTFTEGVLFYLGILLRYKFLIIITTTISAVLVVVFSIVTLMLPTEVNPLPNIYSSNVVIRFQNDTSTLSMDSLLASIGVEGNRRGQSDAHLVVQHILKSGSFLDKLINEFGIIEMLELREKPKTNSRRFVLQNSGYYYDRNSGLMTISFQHTDAVFARDFVNTEIKFLRDWFLEEGGSVKLEQMQLLEQRLLETQKKINELENQIKNFQINYGVISVDALAEQLESIKSDLQSQLVQVDMEIRQYSQYSRIEDPALSQLKAKKQNILSMMSQIDNGYVVNGRKLPTTKELSDLSIEFERLSLDLQIQKDIYHTLAQRYEVLRLAAIEDNIFTILEWGEVPEEKIGPQRSQLCIMVVMLSFLGTIALSFIIHLSKSIISDPEKTKLLKMEKGDIQ